MTEVSALKKAVNDLTDRVNDMMKARVADAAVTKLVRAPCSCVLA